MTKCIFCDTELKEEKEGTKIFCDCRVCGKYNITREARDDFLNSSFSKDSAKISAYLRMKSIRNEIVTVFYDCDAAIKEKNSICLAEIIKAFPSTLSDRIDQALINLSLMSSYMGDYIEFDQFDYPVFCAETKELDSCFFIMQQLFNDGMIENKNQSNTPGFPIQIRLTANGWNRIIQLQRATDIPTNKVFVAMWFNEDMYNVYLKGIDPAIRSTGYEPIRIDFEEHNDKICDRIIADIRKSKFVICDFTGQRGGVYFEAGFALGLGKSVIWTCREDDIDNLHFDTRQYNHIVWKNENDLYEKLKRRIEATII